MLIPCFSSSKATDTIIDQNTKTDLMETDLVKMTVLKLFS